MAHRIFFTTYGKDVNDGRVDLPSFAMYTDNDISEIDAICRAIADKNRKRWRGVKALCQRDGFDPSVNQHHYQITLACPLPSGGGCPVASFYVMVPFKEEIPHE